MKILLYIELDGPFHCGESCSFKNHKTEPHSCLLFHEQLQRDPKETWRDLRSNTCQEQYQTETLEKDV